MTAVRILTLLKVASEPIAKSPPCAGMSHLFYGPDVDGRTERGKSAREAKARSICLNECEYRMPCLERAMVLNECDDGVWGGMTRAERRAFKAHLAHEGYVEGVVPTGNEFWASLYAFYRGVEERMARKAMRV